MDTTNKKLCYAAGCHRPLPPRAKNTVVNVVTTELI